MQPSQRFLIRCLAALACLAIVSTSATAVAAEIINVVATFSVLGDMTSRIGGPRVRVHALVGPDADAHVYQPTPADAKTIAQARLVIINGFGFEGWIARLIKSSGYRGEVLIASKGVRTLARQTGDREPDPHAWQDLANALRYVDNIAQALGDVDPAGQAEYRSNAEKYKAKIRSLDADIRRSLAALPAARRKVVTAHDAFAYFSRAYGIAFIAPVGISTDAEPSAGDVGRIIEQIRRERIPAVFMESISDPRLLERIRRESGARIGGVHYSDSLSKPGGPASSYLDMMRHNASTLEAALAN